MARGGRPSDRPSIAVVKLDGFLKGGEIVRGLWQRL